MRREPQVTWNSLLPRGSGPRPVGPRLQTNTKRPSERLRRELRRWSGLWSACSAPMSRVWARHRRRLSDWSTSSSPASGSTSVSVRNTKKNTTQPIAEMKPAHQAVDRHRGNRGRQRHAAGHQTRYRHRLDDEQPAGHQRDRADRPCRGVGDRQAGQHRLSVYGVGREGQIRHVGDPVEQRPTERHGEIAAAQADLFQLRKAFSPRVRCYLSGPPSLRKIIQDQEPRPTAQRGCARCRVVAAARRRTPLARAPSSAPFAWVGL